MLAREVESVAGGGKQYSRIPETCERKNMVILLPSSRSKTVELVGNLILLVVVLICWFYVLYAGRVATLRYLEKIDFSEPVERITVLQLMKHSGNTNSTPLNAI